MLRIVAALIAAVLLCAQTPMLPGFPPGTFQSRAALDAGSAAAANAWDPAHKNANITLSPGNLIATDTANGFVAAGSVNNHSTGKYYTEFIVNVNNASFCFPGFGNSTATLSSYVGSDNNALSLIGISGNVTLNNSAIATIQTITVGDSVGMAVDFTAQLVWFRTTSVTNWNNSGTASPVTGLGGISFSGIAAGPYFPMGSFNQTGDQITLVPGPTFALGLPIGYAQW